MFDRGFYSFDLIVGAGARGAQVLGRLAAHVKPKPLQALPDGSYLADIFPSEARRRKRGERLRVCVIEYTFTDPQRPGYKQLHRLFTTLLDPHQYPALDLVCAYHERWDAARNWSHLPHEPGECGSMNCKCISGWSITPCAASNRAA